MYASELSEFREDDISQAIRKIAYTPREEGETAFPELGKLARLIQSIAARRRADEAQQREADEMRALEEDRRQHPEKYFTIEDVFRDFMERRRAKSHAEGESAA